MFTPRPPGAKIVLVEAASDNSVALGQAAYQAAQTPGVSVVSMSWGGPDSTYDSYSDSNFVTPAGHTPVAFVASSGDKGVVSYPAASPNVLGVGGTELGAGTTTPGYGLEIAWSLSGGGESQNEPAPAFQTALTGSTHRATPDVSFDADPWTGAEVYCTAEGGLVGGAGTSLGAPCWAGLIADVDQARALAGQPALANVVKDIYGLPVADFHDIVNGSNVGHVATTGYDEVTGRGTPIANLILSGLIYAEQPPGTTNIGVGGGGVKAANLAAAPSIPTTKGPTTTASALPAIADELSLGLASEQKLPASATDLAFQSFSAPSSTLPATKPAFDARLAATDAVFADLFELSPTSFEGTPAMGHRR